MKKQFISLLFLVFLAGPVFITSTADAEFINTLEIGLQSGYRLDQLDWNVADDNVNVLSELDWEDLEIWQLGATGKISVCNDIDSYCTYIRGSFDYGWITDGFTRDSDYNGNNRTLETYRSYNDTNDDNVLDGNIGLGFEKIFWQDRLIIGVLGGYSYHEQNLRLTNLVVVMDNGVMLNPPEPVPGLNSTYETRWHGPFIGLDFKLDPLPRISLSGSVEYHWSQYEAEADWNLKTVWAHPLSFLHETDEADGLVVSLKGSYLLNTGWTLDLIYVFSDFSANDGLYRIFPAVGEPSDNKLNEANWQSSAINLGITYRFK